MSSTRGFSETELNLLTIRQGGIEPVDRSGRLRVSLGSGPESDLVRGTFEVRKSRTHSQSRVLSPRDFQRLYKAVAVANLEGLVLNTFVTISWTLAGLSAPSSVRGAQAAFQERLTSWFQYRRDLDASYPPYAGVWVKEVGRTMGLHTHYLLHVPHRDRAIFARWVRRSVSKATDADPGAARTTARGRALYATHVADLKDDWRQQWDVFRYMSKGLDPDALASVFSASQQRMLAAEYTGLSLLSDEGVIEGQRCGRSRAISNAAIAPWQPVYDAVMDAEWRSAGRKSLHYGQAFLVRGHLGRHLEASGI